jgi:hypothetical protein
LFSYLKDLSFITDMETGNEYFCHNNGLACHIKKGDKVTFELAECSRDYHNAGTLAGYFSKSFGPAGREVYPP